MGVRMFIAVAQKTNTPAAAGVYLADGPSPTRFLYVQKSIAVTNPSTGEDVVLFHADKGFEITKLVAVVRGSGSPSATWNLRHGSDRAAAGTSVLGSNQATSSTTTGDVLTSFASAVLAVGDFLRLVTSALSGTVTELHVTVHGYQLEP